MEELVIDVSPDGVVQGLHMDAFPLDFLGPKKISRASEIHHNESTQKWDIILPGKESPECAAVSSFDGYDIAREFEVKWLQACRKAEIQPYTFLGHDIATRLRTGND